MISDYLTCPKCGRSFLADVVQEFDDRTIKLGRCVKCDTEAAATYPKLAA